MKVIYVIAFLLCIILVTQSFLTACPTPWGILNSGNTVEHQEDIQTETNGEGS